MTSSFKQFGGLAYNSKQNITHAAHSVHTDHVVTHADGAINTRVGINSHIDLSGSSILQVGGIYFADGTVLQTATGTNTTSGTGTGTGTGTISNQCTTFPHHQHPITDPSWDHLIGPEGRPGVDGEAGTNGTNGKDGINANMLTDTNENTSVGSDNLLLVSDNVAKFNVAMGRRVLMKTKTGYANSGFGYETLINNVHGSYNTGIGLQALAYNVTGSHNTALGAGADVANLSLTNATAIGAGARAYKSNTLVLGNKYVTDVITAGIITGKAKNFTIDHPLPAMREQGYVLKHASVESPRLDLIYRDSVTLTGSSVGTFVNLDTMFRMTEGTFVRLCTNPTVFTTNESDWDPVRGSLEPDSNLLRIACKNPQSRARVSFLVIAERKDDGILDAGILDANGQFITEVKSSASA